jgi:hypothetical protein
MLQKPLTPLSSEDFRSPLDDARAEIATLKAENAALKKAQQFKTDAHVLRLQLDHANYRTFLKERGLHQEYRSRFPF